MSLPLTFVGLDVGGTNLKASAFDAKANLLAEEAARTSQSSGSAWRQNARALVQRIFTRCPPPVRVGVAAPGLPARDGFSIAFMPDRLPGLEGLNWQAWLDLDSPVPVFNDARAALLGESWVGAARGASNIVLLTLGTGVGGAAMVDGRILRGHLGRAGHLGHISLDPKGAPDIVGTPGSLEDAIGECSLRRRSAGQFGSTRELVEAYRTGSKEARRIWLDSVQALAAAMAGLINVLDPEVFILGGGIAEAEEALFDPLREALDQFEWRPGGARVRVVKAALGPNAGAAGAAYGAKLLALEQKSTDALFQSEP